MTQDKGAPWERQRDDQGNLEPSLWYDRFTRFRLMLPPRSLLGLVNVDRAKKGLKPAKSIPGSWHRAAKKWRWRERAEAWDAALREQQIREEQAERRKWRQHRKELLIAQFGRLVEAMANLRVEEARWTDLNAGIRIVLQEMRAEFNDLPTQRYAFTQEDIEGIARQVVQTVNREVDDPDVRDRIFTALGFRDVP